MTETRIDVTASAGRVYPVLLAEGLLGRLGTVLDQLGIARRRVLMSTPPIWQLVSPLIAGLPADTEPMLMGDGERYKTLTSVSRLYDGLVRAGVDRASVVVAVGGGVLGDTAGFAAATYLRGLAVVQVPTTLLAQVDSAIGGKVGVNLTAGKNLVGAFHPPAAVIVDPLVLKSLPRREFRAGLYEVVKYAVIADASLFERLEHTLAAIFARDPGALLPVIAECCRIKARVVSEDEHEHGIRRTLNFGHTAAHALEAITRYRRFRHGEAVGYGMLAAAHLAHARGALSLDARDALATLIAHMGPLPPVADLSAADALDVMRRDKKVIGGTLHFVLPTSIGTTSVVTDVTERELTSALLGIGLRET
ncbi:MAG: 3-dehydroquinate synthase [Vicinamibacterales bacterium]